MKKKVLQPLNLLLLAIATFSVSCQMDAGTDQFPANLPKINKEELKQTYPEDIYTIGYGLNVIDQRLSLFDAMIDYIEKVSDLEQKDIELDKADERFDDQLFRDLRRHRIGDSMFVSKVSDEYVSVHKSGNETALRIEGVHTGNTYEYTYYKMQEKLANEESFMISVKDDIDKKMLFSITLANDTLRLNIEEESFNHTIGMLSAKLNAIDGLLFGKLTGEGQLFIACHNGAIRLWNESRLQ